ncbi:MAG: hypothetical protein ACI854_002427 [Arenicella sp.]|jgi:hypothetical protein
MLTALNTGRYVVLNGVVPAITTLQTKHCSKINSLLTLLQAQIQIAFYVGYLSFLPVITV